MGGEKNYDAREKTRQKHEHTVCQCHFFKVCERHNIRVIIWEQRICTGSIRQL